MAYATLLSITQSLEQILHPNDRSLHLRESEQHIIRSLKEKASFLLLFLENDSLKYSESNLETRIRDVAYETEAMIESGFPHRNSKGSRKIVEEFNSILEEVVKMKERNQVADLPQTKYFPTVSEPGSIDKSDIVGVREEMMKIKDRLTGSPSRREIISIVGMPGIGKTTLTKALYDDPSIVQRFDVRAWITVSVFYNSQQMLIGLLDSIQNINHGSYPMDLAHHVYKILKQRRYLIVMDDMWDIKAWEQVRRFFPDDNNGSRIIFTTRLQKVADDVECPDSIYSPTLLSPDDSWKLLYKKAFKGEPCPPEFEGIGKEIANNCKGLPLSLAVIGGILYKAERTLDYWRYTAQNVSSALNDTHDQVMNILSLSYKHLPHHLRACFLYMGVLPEDHAISKFKLIRFWVAEGFIKPAPPSKCLEDVAHEYLEDLIDRNMILIRERNSATKIKKCGIHDLMRDLCRRIAEEEKFIKVVNSKLEMYIHDYHYDFRHVYMHLDSFFVGVFGFLTNFLLYFITESPNIDFLSPLLNSHQLRVLDARENPFSKLQDEIMDPVGLRYISFHCRGGKYELPSSITKLWNLQTLVITSSDVVLLPLEIWMMPQLRHIKTRKCFLPYPCAGENMKYIVPLENLQTLKGVTNFVFSKDSIRMMPNLKKLKIRFELDMGADLSSYCIDNLVFLHQLEALNVSIEHEYPLQEDFDTLTLSDLRLVLQRMTSIDSATSRLTLQLSLPENFSLSPTLIKLTLSGFRLPLKHMASIGSLEHLEMLNLKNITVDGSVWEPTEGEFLQLKSLSISHTNLEWLIADEGNFPSLQSLRIIDCSRLMEIPSGIGYIQTLGLIEVHGCTESAKDSVNLIMKEQQELGNDRLRVLDSGLISEAEFVEGLTRWLEQSKTGTTAWEL